MLWCLNFSDVSPAGAHCHHSVLGSEEGQLLFSLSRDQMCYSLLFSPSPIPHFVKILGPWTEVLFTSSLYLGDGEWPQPGQRVRKWALFSHRGLVRIFREL